MRGGVRTSVLGGGACLVVVLAVIAVVRGRDIPVEHRTQLVVGFEPDDVARLGDERLGRALERAYLLLWGMPAMHGSDGSVVRDDDTFVIDILQREDAVTAIETELQREPTSVELVVIDDNAAVMAALTEPLRQAERTDPAAPTVESDTWTSAAGVVHSDAHLSHASRASIEHYVETATATDPRMRILSDRRLAYEHVRASGSTPEHWRTQLLDTTARIDADTILMATGGSDLIDGARVAVLLDTAGDQALADLKSTNLGRKLAIVVDGDVVADTVIGDGRASGIAPLCITTAGGRALEERDALDLAAALRAGSLPAPMRVLRREPYDRPLASFFSRAAPVFLGAGLLAVFLAVYAVRRRPG